MTIINHYNTIIVALTVHDAIESRKLVEVQKLCLHKIYLVIVFEPTHFSYIIIVPNQNIIRHELTIHTVACRFKNVKYDQTNSLKKIFFQKYKLNSQK